MIQGVMPKKNRLYFFGVLLILQYAAVFEMALTLSWGPLIIERFSLLPSRLALTTLGFVGSGLLAPLMGQKADSWGFKGIFTLLGGLLSLGALAVSLSPTAPLYALSRILTGLCYFASLGLIPAAVVRFTPSEKVGSLSGLYKIFFALAMMTAPLIGSKLAGSLGFVGIYRALALAGLGISLLMAAAKGVPGPEERGGKKNPALPKGSGPFFLSSLFIPFSIALVSTYLGVFLSARGMGQEKIGLVYSVMGLGSVTAGVYSLVLSDRLGKYRSAQAGLAWVVLALALIYPSRGWGIFGAAFLFYLGFDTYTAMFFPTVGLCFPNQGSRVLTAMSAGQSLGMFTVTLAAPVIFRTGFGLNLILAGAATLACALLFATGYRRRRG